MRAEGADSGRRQPRTVSREPTVRLPLPAGVAPDFKPMPFEAVQRIANYYAGKPVHLSYDLDSAGYGGMVPPGGDNIQLTPDVQKALQFLVQNYGTDEGAYKGVPGLATLIHEALHTRGPETEDPVTHRTPYDPNTGFYGWDDEWQAHQLSYGLIADAMQRFFGVDYNTPLGQRYYDTSRSYSYSDPINNPFGGPETPNNIEAWGERTRPETNPYGWYFPWAQQS